MSQIDTEIDKKQNFPIFKVKFHAFFVSFTDFVDWNVLKGQQ